MTVQATWISPGSQAVTQGGTHSPAEPSSCVRKSPGWLWE